MAADFEITLTNPSAKDVSLGPRKVRAGRSVQIQRQRLFRVPQSIGGTAVPPGQDPVERTINDLADAFGVGRIVAVAGGKALNARMMRAILAPDGSAPVIFRAAASSVPEGIECVVVENTTGGPFALTLPDPRDHEGMTLTVWVQGTQSVVLTAAGPGALVGVRALGETVTARPRRKFIFVAETTDPAVGTAIWRVIYDSDGGDVQSVAVAGPVAVSPYASKVLVTPFLGGTTLNLPALPVTTVEWAALVGIKDVGGTAAANNITVNAAAGDDIDGAPAAVIGANFGFLQLWPNGNRWNVVGVVP